MLLGSPPDMVRGFPLRETGSATVRGELNYKFIIYASDKKIKRFFIFFKLYEIINISRPGEAFSGGLQTFPGGIEIHGFD